MSAERYFGERFFLQIHAKLMGRDNGIQQRSTLLWKITNPGVGGSRP